MHDICNMFQESKVEHLLVVLILRSNLVLSLLILFCFFFQLMKPDIFYFIEKHNLQDAIREKVC